MRKVYYGWFVVALAMVVYAVIVGSTYGAFGVFVHPVSADLNLSRAEMNTTLILVSIGMMFLAPFLGRTLDRISPKIMMMVGGVAFALAYVGLSLSPSILLSSGILLLVVPFAYLGGASITLTVLLARWFSAYRGRAMMLAGAGMSLGNIVVTPIVGYMVEHYGWRTALMITGIAVGALVSAAGMIVRDRPGPDDVETRGDGAVPAPTAQPAAGQPMAARAILSEPQFWVLTIGVALALAVYQALAATLIPLALEQGCTMLQATGLISIMGAFAVGGGILLSPIADKVDRALLLAVFFLIGAAINGLLLSAASYPSLAVCAAVLGVSSGAVTAVFYALLAERFGTASFGTVRGLTLVVIQVFGITAVRFSGEVYDRTKAYDLMFITFVVAAILAAVLMLALRFTRAPVLAAPATSST